MTAKEMTGWRDAELSQRHRMWGRDCPMVDVDELVGSSAIPDVTGFSALEYDKGRAKALVEYKSVSADRDRVLEEAGLGQSRMHPSFRALLDLADNHSRGALPMLLVFYWKRPWAFEVFPLNGPAVSVYGWDSAWDGVSLVLTERRFVGSLYAIRERRAPVDVMSKLDNLLPWESEVA